MTEQGSVPAASQPAGRTETKSQDHQHHQCDGGESKPGHAGGLIALCLLVDTKGKSSAMAKSSQKPFLVRATGELVMGLALPKEWRAGDTVNQEPCASQWILQ